MSKTMREQIAEIVNKWTGNHPWGMDSEPILAIEQLLAAMAEVLIAHRYMPGDEISGCSCGWYSDFEYDVDDSEYAAAIREWEKHIRSLHPDLRAVLEEYARTAHVRGLKFAISAAEEESDPETIIEILQERIAELEAGGQGANGITKLQTGEESCNS